MGATAIASLSGCGGSGNQFSNTNSDGTEPKIADGYTDQQSYRPGDRVTLFLNSQFPQRTTLNLYDYADRLAFQFTADVFSQSPSGPRPWETGFGYQDSVTFTLPNLPSGVYLVEGLIPLIVKTAPTKSTDVVILYPTNTMAAYNSAGGRSMYSEPVPAPIVSFQRPTSGSNLAFFSAFLEWFAGLKLDYSVRYIADIDLEDFNEISAAKLVIVIGHSEYWTRRARENFDQFILSGGNSLFLSGNNMWWQVRYSEDRTQMICYKEAADPVADPLLRTINWTRRELAYPTLRSLGADFVHGGYGLLHSGKSTGFRVLSPDSPVFRGVFVRRGDLIAMPTIEYDGSPLLNSPTILGLPQLDRDALDAYRAEIIGYELCGRNEAEKGEVAVANNVATWLAYQRAATSGIVINGASTNWCSRTGAFGADGYRIRKIILNMIDILLNRKTLFVS